jgi:outer membrane protein assembly factor BamD
MKLLSILFLLISCAIERPAGSSEAEVLYKEAIAFKNDGHYLAALEKINQIRSKHPYSYFATHAELLNADILFLQENFIESAAAYSLFKTVHPTFDNLPYVVFKMAESYYNQLPGTYDRDLTMASEAIKNYRDLIKNYPTSPFVEESTKKIKECENMLAQKEKYIGDFYFKTGEYDSARYRFLEILKENELQSLREHSMIRIVQSSYYLKDYVACLNYAKDFMILLPEKMKSWMANYIKKCEKEMTKT